MTVSRIAAEHAAYDGGMPTTRGAVREAYVEAVTGVLWEAGPTRIRETVRERAGTAARDHRHDQRHCAPATIKAKQMPLLELATGPSASVQVVGF